MPTAAQEPVIEVFPELDSAGEVEQVFPAARAHQLFERQMDELALGPRSRESQSPLDQVFVEIDIGPHSPRPVCV